MKGIRSDLKIIIVGNAGTGKTSFVQKWTKNQYTENYKATIVSEFGYKIFEYKGKAYRIQVWDLAGQDKNTILTKVFCKDSHGVVILSDVSNNQSLDATIAWKHAIDDSVTYFDGSPLPMMLIQNKIDLIDPSDYNESNLIDFGKRNGFICSYQTSVKANLNVFVAMNEFLSYVIDKTENLNSIILEKNNSIVLSKDKLFKNQNNNDTDGKGNSIKTGNGKKNCC